LIFLEGFINLSLYFCCDEQKKERFMVFIKRLFPFQILPILAGFLIFGFAAILLLSACTKETEPAASTEGSTETASEEDPTLIVQPVQAVCLFDGLSIWAGPSTKKGYLNYEIKKGEAITWLGKSAKEEDDDRERDFLNIRLTDGTEGWAIAAFIAVEAEPATLIEQASIYSKNNLISKTDLHFEPMDIVAVLEKQEEWIKVRGAYNRPEYWIKPGNLSFAEVDIAVAYQYLKAQEEKDDSSRKDSLVSDILEEEAFTDSIFIPKIQAEVQEIIAAEAKALEELESEEFSPLEDRESTDTPESSGNE
jgi:hypothetical protein